MAQTDVGNPITPAAEVNGTRDQKAVTTDSSNTPPKDAPQGPVASNTLATLVTGIILVALLAGIAYQIVLASSATDLTWTRVVYALGPIESIAFAAAGWMFGREVHRQQAQQAEQRATQAHADARSAQQDAITSKAQADQEKARGSALSAAVLEKARGATNGSVRGLPDSDVNRVARGGGGAPSEVNDLAAIAAALYPEVARR